jgi:hypothetical protein
VRTSSAARSAPAPSRIRQCPGIRPPERIGQRNELHERIDDEDAERDSHRQLPAPASRAREAVANEREQEADGGKLEQQQRHGRLLALYSGASSRNTTKRKKNVGPAGPTFFTTVGRSMAISWGLTGFVRELVDSWSRPG